CKRELSSMGKLVESHSSSIKKLEQQIGKMSAVLKQRQVNDQCMAVATIRMKTTIELEIPKADSNKEENILDLEESREIFNVPSDPLIEVRNMPPGQSKGTHNAPLKRRHEAQCRVIVSP
ncbi:hypothetical protein HAX54_047519, partial [Datura stramonium]|nr:hypothetical protein [Datura stramonium]